MNLLLYPSIKKSRPPEGEFMKKRIFPIMLMLSAFYGSAFSQQETADKLFRDIRKSSIERLPDSFTAELKGESIDKKLSSIPRDSYLDKSKGITVAVSYSKRKGISIQVMNVDDLYRDIYKDLPRQFFAFDILLSDKSTESFLSQYDVSFYNGGDEMPVLKLRIRNAENTVLIYINKEDNQIKKIDYLLGNSLMSTTQVFYDSFSIEGKNYSIPARFVSKITGNNSEKTEVFEIVNINLR
jgi:hypothetical protein